MQYDKARATATYIVTRHLFASPFGNGLSNVHLHEHIQLTWCRIQHFWYRQTVLFLPSPYVYLLRFPHSVAGFCGHSYILPDGWRIWIFPPSGPVLVYGALRYKKPCRAAEVSVVPDFMLEQHSNKMGRMSQLICSLLVIVCIALVPTTSVSTGKYVLHM